MFRLSANPSDLRFPPVDLSTPEGLLAVGGDLRPERLLEAYRHAKLPLTTADPRLISPADLLHMREGDVPSVRTEQALQYVGHLKTSILLNHEMAVSLAD